MSLRKFLENEKERVGSAIKHCRDEIDENEHRSSVLEGEIDRGKAFLLEIADVLKSLKEPKE